MLINDDEDLLSGYLTVTVHSGEGFLHACSKKFCLMKVLTMISLSFNLIQTRTAR